MDGIRPEDFDRAAAYCASWYTSSVFDAMTPAEQDYYRGRVAKVLELCGITARTGRVVVSPPTVRAEADRWMG